MKVLPFKIPKPDFDGLVYQEDSGQFFFDKLHQHEEIQISQIIEGEGSLVVGDTINYYKSGDLVIIGSHLPHVFKSDSDFGKDSLMLTLFFTKTSFGTDFFELEELNILRAFFKRAKHGFKITSHKKRSIQLFNQLKVATKLSRFIILLELLQLSSKANYESLSSFIYEKKYSDNEGNRMRDVIEFTMTHYTEDISLIRISQVAAMSKNAFCKYFKKRTNKTYMRFLNEIRIEHAAKLLLSFKEMSIAEIAEVSGYNNISNFNRQFKSIKLLSPSTFKKSRSS